MDREKFIQSSIRIRNLEKKLLTKAQFERLESAVDLKEAFKYLKESSYLDELSKLERVENFDRAFSASLNKMYKDILEMSPEKELVEVLTYKYGFHNIKVALKEKILGEDLKEVYSSLYDNMSEKIKKQIEEDSKEKDKWYEDTALRAYKIYQETKDPQKIEFFIDKMYFKKILEISKKFNLKIVEEYFRKMIDFINIKTFIRCQKQDELIEVLKEAWIEGGKIEFQIAVEYFHRDILEFVEKIKNRNMGRGFVESVKKYKETGLLLNFEKYMDNYLTSVLSEGKRITYGPEVLFAYIHAKEMEVKNLRITFVAKSNGLSNNFIKERLRETYV